MEKGHIHRNFFREGSFLLKKMFFQVFLMPLLECIYYKWFVLIEKVSILPVGTKTQDSSVKVKCLS